MYNIYRLLAWYAFLLKWLSRECKRYRYNIVV